jgi:hypothetical protein
MIMLRAIRAEVLKLNRTLALVLAILAPLSVNGLMWLGVIRTQTVPPDFWKSVASNVLFFWGVMMMPLFIALESALLAGLDHNANSWKHLYALSIPRWTIYMAKQIVMLGLIALSNVVLCIGIWLVGAVTQALHLKPQFDFSTPFPLSLITQAAFLIFLAAWLIIAIHTFVAVRWPSIAVSIGLGITMVVAAAFGANNQDWALSFPWSLPTVVMRTFLTDNGQIATTTLTYSIVGGLLIAALGCWYVTRRNVLN